MKVILFILSLIFVLFSFFPSLYELYYSKNLPQDRAFVLEHNYMFDYNFYLSRIRQGQEGKWLVSEKYYNQEHQGSFIQIFYLVLGRFGRLGGLSPPAIYHLARLIFGFILLVFIGRYLSSLFSSWWIVFSFLFIVTSGSWPVILWSKGFIRFGTYMGWWSVIDSLQRITFIPHILFGQLGLILFIWWFGQKTSAKSQPKADRPLDEFRFLKLLKIGALGFIAGIVFPPTLIVVYTVFVVLSLLEIRLIRTPWEFKIKEWLRERVVPRITFILLSIPALIYLQIQVKVPPWSALPLFDIQHRILLPYKEYFLALGPILPFGILGLILSLVRKEKKLLPAVAWVLSIFLLFRIFERIPTQSPLRFTEAVIHIPLGILATYFFYSLWERLGRLGRLGVIGVTGGVMLLGLSVMVSMVFWLTDQVRWKAQATWPVPIGAQLAYPLKDFMDGIYFIRDNTKRDSVVLSYVTAGNFIPAYAGNFVYIGHANTPDEDGKEKIAARFFSGKMKTDEAKEFLKKENVSYVFFGPQEREVGNIKDLISIYPIVQEIYRNQSAVIYKVI